MQNRFFAVTAKCGHVGRQFYYEGTFYIKAFTMSEAATITRGKPRVKHDHKDAILWVEEITAEAYKKGLEAFNSEVYFHCKSKWQHNLVWDEIAPKVHPEIEYTQKYRKKMRYEQCEARQKIKKPYKRERFVLYRNDLDLVIA